MCRKCELLMCMLAVPVQCCTGYAAPFPRCYLDTSQPSTSASARSSITCQHACTVPYQIYNDCLSAFQVCKYTGLSADVDLLTLVSATVWALLVGFQLIAAIPCASLLLCWCLTHPQCYCFICCDLPCCDLSRCDLSCCDLPCCDLSCCDLSCCDLSCCDLPCCDLPCCDLPCCDRSCCDLSCCDLSCCDPELPSVGCIPPAS